ncbi:MAG: restriction endonuclease subunit S [Cyanobacteriota bacterium]|jgi:type I restriction enzyme S subunit
MNAERLLDHFEHISEAPDAVARLRRFILDLAVRGKLVEPPKSWLECTLGDVGEWGSGGTPLRTKSEYYGGDIPWLVIGDLNDGLVTTSATTITEEGLANSSAKIVDEGTLLIAMYGSIGKLGVAGMRCATNQAIAFCRPYSDMAARDYLFVLLKSLRNELLQQGQGVAQQNISQKILKAHPVELPPLTEQHRIVAKVDELMALCDQLEAARQQREQGRERLMAGTLQRLNQPAEDPTTARNDARFALQVLPSITTTPAQIKQLRQTILNLAVRGKLVEQDPEDEPAVTSGIFKKHQAQSPKGAKRRRSTSMKSLDMQRWQQLLPPGWASFRLAELVAPDRPISYGVLVPGDNVLNGIPFVRAQDLTLDAHLSMPSKSISPEIDKAYARTRLVGGEILLCVVGSIGKLGVAPLEWAGANIARAVARIAPISDSIRDYLLIALRSSHSQSFFLEATRTLAQPTLNIGLLEEIRIPLPPLAEQHRIVAKVDELVNLCDRLEQQLSQADQQRRRLLEAVLAEALRAPEKALASVGSA